MSIAGFQNLRVLLCLFIPARAMSNATAPSATSRLGPWDENLEESSRGGANQSSAWKNHYVQRNMKSQTSTVTGLKFAKDTMRRKTSVTKVAYIDAMWKRFGTTTRHSRFALQKMVSIKGAMEEGYPDIQYLFGAVIGSLVILTAKAQEF